MQVPFNLNYIPQRERGKTFKNNSGLWVKKVNKIQIRYSKILDELIRVLPKYSLCSINTPSMKNLPQIARTEVQMQYHLPGDQNTVQYKIDTNTNEVSIRSKTCTKK